jgi:hypothetical protein
MKPRRPPLPLAATALFAMLYLAAPAIAATVNFAQSDQTVAPAPADARRLATYFSPPYHTGPLPSAVEEMLWRSAPAELRAECAATVDSWNRATRGRSRVSVRILGVANGSAWLAYRCASGNADDARLPQSEGNYTERVAVFNSARRTIQFLGLKAREDTAATLYHVGLAENVKLRGAENSATFVVFAISSNARDGSPSGEDRQAENRFVVIANSATAAKLVLALVTARKGPGAGGGDAADADASSSDEYRAALRLDHDLAGHLTAIDAYYREAPSGARSHFGRSRYVWNPATFRFAVAKPLPAPSLRQHPVRLPPVPGYSPLAY